MLVEQVNIDVETYSELDLKKVGAAKYSRHESTECLIFSYSINKNTVKTWIPANGPIPRDLDSALWNNHVAVKAFNAEFERNILENVLGIYIPTKRWRCTMIKALYNGLPPSLEACGEVIGTDVRKDKAGKKLIGLFSKDQPRGKGRVFPQMQPDQFHQFIRYCEDDVRTELDLDSRLLDLPEWLWDEYAISVESNERGLPINLTFVSTAIEEGTEETRKLIERAKQITGLDNPNSVVQLRGWLEEKGVETTNLTKKTLAKLAESAEGEVKEIIDIRQKTSKTSIRKYETLRDAACPDQTIKGCFQFYGASRTGRDAGRIFQPQNLPRGEISADKVHEFTECLSRGEGLPKNCENVMSALSSCIRSSIQAPYGRKLVVSDLSAIECRVLAWITRCDKILETFKLGRDVYKDFASYLFNKKYEEVTKEERTLAKPAVLGCGYRLGKGEVKVDGGEERYTGLLGYGRDMGINLSPEEAAHGVEIFRSTYPEIVKSWYTIEGLVYKVVKFRKRMSVNLGGTIIKAQVREKKLMLQLPSGRSLNYHNPEIRAVKTPWGSERENLTYEGVDSITKKWVRQTTHGGKLIENITQAIARDILFHGMGEAVKAGFEVVGRVHDELIAMTLSESDLTHRDLSRAMCVKPKWAPTIPLDAEGFESGFYRK